MLNEEQCRAAPKGQRKHGPCNVTACQQPGAIYWNTSTLAWYCRKCALAINAVPMSTPPLCVHMNSLPHETPGHQQQVGEDEIARIIHNNYWADDYDSAPEIEREAAKQQARVLLSRFNISSRG